jgi:cell shape-determining protein MreC
VDKNAVVAAAGLQLLGKVIEVSNRQCVVQPITSKAAGGLIGVVMFDDEHPARSAA